MAIETFLVEFLQKSAVSFGKAVKVNSLVEGVFARLKAMFHCQPLNGYIRRFIARRKIISVQVAVFLLAAYGNPAATWAAELKDSPGRLSETYRDSRRVGPKMLWPTFSPDSRRVAVQICDQFCMIQIIEVSSGVQSEIAPRNDATVRNGKVADFESFMYPSFHPNGRHVVFTRYRANGKADRSRDSSYSLAIAEISGPIVSEGLRSQAFKGHPLILNDGNRVFFVGLVPVASSQYKGPLPNALYVGDLRESSSSRLPGNLTALQFIPLRQFGEEVEVVGLQVEPIAGPRAGLYRVNWKNGAIRLVQERVGRLGQMQSLPDGGLAYVQRTDDLDQGPPGPYVYDFYIRTDGHVARLTHGLGHVRSFSGSPDGKMLAAIVVPRGEKGERLFFLNIQERTLRRIFLSSDSRVLEMKNGVDSAWLWHHAIDWNWTSGERQASWKT